jgi:4-amino-4-deoxy-L-arabinose transferase-like glycosyltransferase
VVNDRILLRVASSLDPSLAIPRSLALLTVGLAATLRFWKLGSLHWYGQDEAGASFAAWRLIHEHQVILAGPPNSRGVYLGPGYYYLVAPFYWLFDGDPYASAFLAAVAGTGTAYLLWQIGRCAFDEATGLLTALLFATSPMAVLHGRSGWNPNVLPFLSVLLIFSLLRIRQTRWGAPLAASSAALAPQCHPSGLMLPVVLIAWVMWKRPAVGRRVALASGVAGFLPLLPVVIAELHTRFAGVRSWLRLLRGDAPPGPEMGGLRSSALAEFLASNFLGSLTAALALCVIAAVGIFVIWRKQPAKREAIELLLLAGSIGLIGFASQSGALFQHYLLPWLPGILALVGAGVIAVSSLEGPRSGMLQVALASIILTGNVGEVLHPQHLPAPFRPESAAAFHNTEAVVDFIADRAHGPFDLELWSPYPWDRRHDKTDAFRYLLMLRGLKPSSDARSVFVIGVEALEHPGSSTVRWQIARRFRGSVMDWRPFGDLAVFLVRTEAR